MRFCVKLSKYILTQDCAYHVIVYINRKVSLNVPAKAICMPQVLVNRFYIFPSLPTCLGNCLIYILEVVESYIASVLQCGSVSTLFQSKYMRLLYAKLNMYLSYWNFHPIHRPLGKKTRECRTFTTLKPSWWPPSTPEGGTGSS